jgi:hypothetical protein
MYTEGIKTFTADGALLAYRRVKISSGTTTTPPQVEYAGVGEQHIGITQYGAADGALVAVKLRTADGSQEASAADTFAIGATLYGAANGQVSDTASGSAIGEALEACTGANDIVEIIEYGVLSTTAANVSVADAGEIVTGGTVEAALAEIMVGIKTAQYTIQPDWITAEAGTALTAYAASPAGGVGFAQLSNKSQVIQFGAHATPAKIAAHFTLPQDLDDAQAAVLHLLGALSAASPADTPTFTVEAYFDVVGAAPSADTNCGGASGEFSASTNLQEKTLSLALGDVPAAPCTLTLILNPTDGQLGDVDFYLSGLWLEVTRKCLTA